jgi:MFS transporter, DHA1 family, multidrug resistance protein
VRADLRFTLLQNARMLRQRNRGIDRMDVTDGSETQHWQRTLWTMVGVQFVMSISFSILSPIMPLFLPELGVFSRDAVAVWAGVLASITSFVAIFTAPLWGSLADRYGRKLMVLRSTLGIALFTLLMGLAQSPWHMVAIRAGMGALAGFNSAATLLVSTQVPEQRLGSSLGWLGTGQLVGSLIGPIIGGGVADLTGSYRIPFFFAGVISLVAFAGTWWFVPERFTPPTGVRQRRSLLAGISVLTRTRGLVPLIVVMLMAQFATQAVQPVVTLFVQEMLGDRPDLATLGGLAFSVTGMAGVLAVPVLGRRSDIIGYRTVLLICLFGAALFTAPQAVPLGYWAFVAERFGLGLFVGGILPAANSLIGRLTTVTSRGFVYGMVSSAYFVGNTLGPLTGGTIAATVGIRLVFVVTAALLLINLVWVWFTVPEVRTAP